MMVIMQMENQKVMENIFQKMVFIILDNGLMVWDMVEERYIIKMALLNTMVTLIMIKAYKVEAYLDISLF